MKRFISGIILVAIAVLSLIGNFGITTTPEPGSAILGFFMFAIGGALLIYFGKKSKDTNKAILEASLQMLKESDVISAGDIASKVGISEIKVREVISKSQRKGIIPFKAEIK